MTQEEKIKEAKRLYESANADQRYVLKSLFPELAQSEDEKMMNQLHSWMKEFGGAEEYTEKVYQWIKGLLEKQGEQKPANNKGMNIDEDSMTPFQKKVFCIIDTAIEEEQGLKQVCDELLSLASNEIEQKPVVDDKDAEKASEEYRNFRMSCGIKDPVMLNEIEEAFYEGAIRKQKPAWSEEDKIALDDALWCCKQAASIAKDENDMGNVWYAERWLKSIKDRVLPQPKREWSEEDEKMINKLLAVVKLYYDRDGDDLDKQSCISWLKSLRPQNWTKKDKERYISCLQRLGTGDPKQPETINSKWFKEHVYPQPIWKPSEGQLECLGYAIEKAEKDWSLLTNNRIYLTLKALKEQLLELRGSKV